MSRKKLIWILLKRDIIPADDGSVKTRGLLHWVAFYLLPTLGLLLLLSVIALAGIWLGAEDQAIEKSLKEAKESHYMALFAEGYLYDQELNVNDTTTSSDYDPASWGILKLKDLGVKGAPPELLDERVFDKVYPFSKIYLNIKTKDGNHINAVKGMAIDFEDPDRRNDGLIREIQKHSLGTWPYQGGNAAFGIIISEAALKNRLRYNDNELPSALSVRTSKKDKKEILLNTVVVKHLPYFNFIMPMREWRRLENRFYYKNVDSFQIRFLGEFSNEDIRHLKDKLPEGSRIGHPFISGGTRALRITLPKKISMNKKWTNGDVHNAFQIGFEDRHDIQLHEGNYTSGIETYGGAMLYLNPKILSKEMLDLGLLLNLKNFFDDQEALKVRGELIQTLQKAWQDQQHLGRMSNIFKLGYVALGGVLMIFFAIVLHTRLHRIGTMRMLGVPKSMFLFLYFIEGMIFLAFAFGLSLIISLIWMPEGIQYDLLSRQTLELIASMAIATTIGLLVPSLWFLNKLQAAEMVSYRTG
jgi:hypothetical protein